MLILYKCLFSHRELSTKTKERRRISQFYDRLFDSIEASLWHNKKSKDLHILQPTNTKQKDVWKRIFVTLRHLRKTFEMTIKNIKCQSSISPLLGNKSQYSIIQVKKKTGQESTTTVSFNLRVTALNRGVTTGDILTGNEQPLFYDEVQIEKLRYCLQSPEKHCVQNAQETEHQLIDSYNELLNLMFFIQVCGYTANRMDFIEQSFTLKPIHYGFNKPTTPTSKRIIRPYGVLKDEDLTDPQQHSFNLDLIDQAFQHARGAYPKIHPIHINNREFYVLFLHPTQVTQLQKSTAANLWKDIQNANERISCNQNHPLFENALGIYRNVILRESAYVTNGVHSTNNTALANVRRAVLLGSQSVIMAFGKNYSFETVSINSDENPPTMALETIIGMKKTRFTSPYSGQEIQDLATLVISTYATYQY